MPLILEFEYEDGEREVRRIPAEIWKMSEPTVTKVFVTDRPSHAHHAGSILRNGRCGHGQQRVASTAGAHSL